MKKIFFTGVTGFLGQFLAVTLLKMDYEIIFLVRSSKHIGAEDRVAKSLDFVDEDASEKYANQYSVVVGDVTWSNFGIKDLCIFNDVEEIWHIAGAVTFSESGRDATFKINLDGAKNMIALADKINVQSVHYCSTAYVRRPGCEHVDEDRMSLDHEDGYNPYERSKNFAERLVHNWSIANPDKQVVIYRPSIIVGDSQSGKVAGFTGYYRFMETFHLFADKFQGKKVNVPGKNGATVNLVTIDWVVDAIARLQKCKCQGVTI
jgi:nucleoside-diphosphate-sugar epimerase